MNELNHPETTKHVIVNDGETFTYHIVEPQHCFSTGQPHMVVFDTEEEAKQAYPQAFTEILDSQISSIPNNLCLQPLVSSFQEEWK